MSKILQIVDWEVPQADWNQADETQSDYIKNRTHYIGTTMKPILEEQTIALSEINWEEDVVTFTIYEPIVEGKDYYVDWNGNTYVCTAWSYGDDPPALYLGNGDMAGIAGYGNGSAPFVFISEVIDVVRVLGGAGTEDVAFSINTTMESVVPLEEKFIPDTIARTVAVDEIFVKAKEYTDDLIEQAALAQVTKKSVSGEIVRIDDAVPVSHPLSVKVRRGKNLFNKSATPAVSRNCTVTELDTGVRTTSQVSDETTAYASACFALGRTEDFINKTLSFYAKVRVSGSNRSTFAFGFINPYINKTFPVYWASRSNSVDGNTYGGAYTVSVTDEEISAWPFAAIWLYANSAGECVVGDYIDYTDVQVEINDTSTEYEPFIDRAKVTVSRYGETTEDNLATFTSDADGIVSGVTSLSPTTTLQTDTDHAVMDVEYYKDTVATRVVTTDERVTSLEDQLIGFETELGTLQATTSTLQTELDKINDDEISSINSQIESMKMKIDDPSQTGIVLDFAIDPDCTTTDGNQVYSCRFVVTDADSSTHTRRACVTLNDSVANSWDDGNFVFNVSNDTTSDIDAALTASGNTLTFRITGYGYAAICECVVVVKSNVGVIMTNVTILP